MKTLTVTVERGRIDALFSRVEDIEGVAHSLPEGDPRRSTLVRVAEQELQDAAPVRPVIAADLLRLTEKTVRVWMQEGVLTVAQRKPRPLIEPSRLHEVLRIVRELRSAGQTRSLLDEVFRRLSDAALLSRSDLQESLAQMARGEGTVVRDPDAVA